MHTPTLPLPRVLSWHAGIDYLRITAPLFERDQFPVWRKLLRRAVAQTDGAYDEKENVELLGYYGNMFAGSFVGENDRQGLMMHAAGLTADSLARQLPQEPYGVPRLDLQVTLWLAEDDQALAQRVADGHMARRGPAEKQPLPKLIRGFGDGDTLYAGSRGGNGSAYLRVYDKWRRSGEAMYRYAWRYEAELTNRRALPAFLELRQRDFSAVAVAEIVKRYCDLRLVDLPPIADVAAFDPGLLPRSKSDDASRLRWLSDQVNPAIARLQAFGYNDAYLRTLVGLQQTNGAIEDDTRL